MKLIIFGSTGTVGRHLVGQALSLGQGVTAFARNPERLEISRADVASFVLKQLEDDIYLRQSPGLSY
jgi:uncharacterized protein YbjT (DUF2867 family)